MSQLIATIAAVIALTNSQPADELKIDQHIVITTVAGQQMQGRVGQGSDAEQVVLTVTTGGSQIQLPINHRDIQSVSLVAAPTAPTSGLSMAELAHQAIFGN